MGSIQQLIVGGLLLTTAFLFGRYLTNPQVGDETQVTSESKTLNLRRQEESNPNVLPKILGLSLDEARRQSDKDPQRSLRERIVGERANRQSGENRETDDQQQVPMHLQPASQLAANLGDEIVVPDFSHLEQAAQLPSTASDRFSQGSRPRAVQPSQHLSMPRLSNVAPRRGSTAQNVDRDVQPIGDQNDSPDFRLPDKPDIANIDATNDRAGHSARHANSVFQPKMPKRDLSTQQRRVRKNRGTGANLVAVDSKDHRLIVEAAEFQSYETVFGDTLHSLSTKFFGKPDYYLDIYLANRDVFENPAHVPINTKIKIPIHKNQR